MGKIFAMKKNVLENVYDPSVFRTIGHELIDLLADHLEKVQSDREHPVLPYKDPEVVLDYWKKDFSSDTGVMDMFGNILSQSINVHHPRYIGHQVAVPAFISSLSGLISDVMSNGTGVYEMGMAANAIERIVTDLVAQRIGYDQNASGLLTSGGSLANLTALLAARKAKAPSAVWEKGHQEKLAILVSEEAHYCIDRAARILGLGEEGIIKVPVNRDYSIDTSKVTDCLEEAQSKGLHVIAIIGCACSTATGSYDDLEFLGDFASRHNLWFHVDGAHGAGVIFSEKYKHLVKGIAKADSVVLDFHKMLMTPALNTALIFKNSRDSYRTFEQKAQYLWDSQHSQEWYNSGKRTFECTKLMMSIKVYAILKAYGEEAFSQNVNTLYDLAETFSEMIDKQESFELAHHPQANIVNFRYAPQQVDIDLNTLNNNIRQALIQSGKFYVVQTTINGEKYLRTTMMNPLTTKDDLIALIEEVHHLGTAFVKEKVSNSL